MGVTTDAPNRASAVNIGAFNLGNAIDTAFIRSVVDRIIVEEERIMIKGRTDILQNLVSKPATGGT